MASVTVTQVDPRILALLDVLAELPPTQIVLWTYEHPHAAESLRMWAATRMLRIEETISDPHHALMLWRDNRIVVTVRLDDPREQVRTDFNVSQAWLPAHGDAQ